MSDDVEGASEGEGKAKGGKLKLIILAVIGLLVLGGGGAGAAFMLGVFGGDEEAAAADALDEDGGTGGSTGDDDGASADGSESASSEKKRAKETMDMAEAGDYGPRTNENVAFVDLPDLLVNLGSSERRMRYLKLRVALEVSNEEVAEQVTALTPRIMDSFQLYLRALDVEEVAGSAGMQRLKEELMARVNLAIRPTRIDDVLFKEILVQ